MFSLEYPVFSVVIYCKKTLSDDWKEDQVFAELVKWRLDTVVIVRL